MNVIKFLHAAGLPLLCFGILFGVYLVWVQFDLPPKEELIHVLEGFIEKWGPLIVVVGAFFEALLLVGLYVPGSMVIFLSVILAPTPLGAAVSVGLVTIGLYAGYAVNFFLGKYGWYQLLIAFGIHSMIEEAQQKLTRYGIHAIFTGYWSPGFASFIATAAGTLQYPARTFFTYSFLALVMWNTVWGVLVYSIGEQALYMFLGWPIIIISLVVWTILRYFQKDDTRGISL